MQFYFILIGISILFFVLLGIKELFNKKLKKRFCVLCVSIVFTWVILLILNFLNLFEDKTLIAILMGESSLGIFYLIEEKFGNKIKIFRLPTILSFISIIYFILEGFNILSFIVLLFLWGIFFVIYLFRNSEFKSHINKLVDCCRNF